MHAEITVEPYDARIDVVTTRRELARLLRQAGCEDDSDLCQGAVYRLRSAEGTGYVVYLPRDRCEETLYHEALHLTVMLMEHFGVVVSAENDEVMAHTQGHVVRQIDAAVYRRRRPKRKAQAQ